MRIKVKVPTSFADLLGGSREFEVEAETVFEAIEQLRISHLKLYSLLFDQNRSLRPFVRAFVNEVPVRDTNLRFEVPSTLIFISAIAGG